MLQVICTLTLATHTPHKSEPTDTANASWARILRHDATKSTSFVHSQVFGMEAVKKGFSCTDIFPKSEYVSFHLCDLPFHTMEIPETGEDPSSMDELR
jgi:hypothetical protein